MRARRALWLGVLLLLAPAAAQACSVCFSATEDTRAAFIWTTVFLSVLPPAMIGGLVYWLVRRARALEAEREGSGSVVRLAAGEETAALR